MRVTLEPGYVLHRRAWRDSSLIVEAFTAAHGRIGLIARGARRPKARLHGLLQPFCPLLLSWSQRGDLGTLTAAEGAGWLALQGRALISGFYANELLMRLLARHDAHPGLFQAYRALLDQLVADRGEGGRREERALRLFEKTLLDEIGYGLVLDHDALSGAPIEDGAEYDYYPDRGPIGAGQGVREDEASGRSPTGAVRVGGRSLLALARGDLEDPQSLREVKGLMRIALAARLGPRPLHSRALFRPPSGGAAGGGERDPGADGQPGHGGEH